MNTTTLLSEIRYAERLCQRTARLYRRLHTLTVFLGVVGGSGVMAAVGGHMPHWVPIAGGVVMGLFGAVNLAMRPADKAAANELDAKRYAQLRSAGYNMPFEDLQIALNKARETDTPEIEALRDVAYNDLAHEIGRDDALIPLHSHQKLLRALA